MILENEIVLGGTTAPAAYQIERSLRFNSADSAYLSWTPPQAGNRKTWTWSGWVKRSKLGTQQTLLIVDDGTYYLVINFNTSDQLVVGQADAGWANNYGVITNGVYRDVGAWMHVVVAMDTTQATAANRTLIYVNGSLAFVSAGTGGGGTYITQNYNTHANSTFTHRLGGWPRTSFYTDNYITEVNFIDGYTPSTTTRVNNGVTETILTELGEFSTATGIWIPKAYTGSYGQNGFYLPFNDNSTVLNLGRNRQTLTADPYFPYTTLLLNGNQPSGVTDTNNNVFKDSSSNNFTITRSGATNNTTQGTFSPFSQTGWSNYFDGTGDSVGCSTNAIAATGQFCFEAWVYQTSRSTTVDQHIFSQYTGGAGGRFYIRFNDTVLAFTSGLASVNGATTLNLNTWYHVVVTRDSSDKLRIFVNGVLDGSVTVTGSLDTTASVVGATASANYWFGYISNVRVVSGSIPTAYQTSSTTNGTSVFTPPTSPLTAVSGTSLLTCNANRFVDGSASPMTLTVNGNSSVQAFSPFAPTAAYSAATNGGSGYFDGAGDYLTAGAVTDWVFLNRFNVDFTISFWLFHPSASTPYGIISTGWNTTEVGFNIVVNNSGNNIITTFFNRGVSGSAASFDSSANLVPNAWNYVTITYTTSSKTVAFYINGAASGSGSNTGFAYSSSNPAFTLNVGRSIGGTAGSINNLNGYLSGLRILNGSIGSTTLPTEPPTNITNTSILLNFTNAGIFDATGRAVLETVGSAQISTTQSKFGGSSMYFDGTVATSRVRGVGSMYNLGGSDFTVEFWYYPTANNTTGYPVLWTNYETWTGGTGLYGQIGLLAGNKDRSPVNSIYLTLGDNYWYGSSTVPTLNTWMHIALVRQGNQFMVFINGVREINQTISVTMAANAMSIIGGGIDTGGLNKIFGYIDDFRQTKFARYTGNFTPPAAQFAYNQADINVKQWVPNNFSVTAGTGNDSLVDSPTNYGTDTGAGGEVRGNYATWNPLQKGSALTLSNGNLDAVSSSASYNGALATMVFPSGKIYFEATITAKVVGNNLGVGMASPSNILSGRDGSTDTNFCYLDTTSPNGSATTFSIFGSNYSYTSIGAGDAVVGDVMMVAYDYDTGKLWLGAKNTWYNSGNPASGTNPTTTFSSPKDKFPYVLSYSTSALSVNFGQRPFAYTAPSGFKALCTQNLPTPAIGASSTTQADDYFNAVAYSGNSSTQTITTGFQPDLVWIKSRSTADVHTLQNVISGARYYLISNSTAAEATQPDSDGVSSFTSTGFSLGYTDSDAWNKTGNTYISWAWKANGAGVSNTAGSITSTVSANTAAGIAVVTYTGTGANATVGHGLGVAPKMVIIKDRTSGSRTVSQWPVYHASVGNTKALYLNATDAAYTDSTCWQNTTPTSSVFSIGTWGGLNYSGDAFVAYCFAEVAGFSKFGSYTGNASTDGPFVYCGFRPRFVMMKRTDSTSDWLMLDAARGTVNVVQPAVLANSSIAEITSTYADFLSNGFKLRDAATSLNVSGGTYIFAAFAEAPFNYSRAR